MDDTDLRLFEEARPRLLGLAYRILGSRADAEDAVQDCFLKWKDADRSQVRTPAAWLSSVCTRRCLDILRAADRARVDYVGPWLPEPIHPATPPAVDGKLAASLTTAFLLLLERLTPKERAAYLSMRSSTSPMRRSRRYWKWTRLHAESSSREPVRISIATRFATSRRGKRRTACCAPFKRPS